MIKNDYDNGFDNISVERHVRLLGLKCTSCSGCRNGTSTDFFLIPNECFFVTLFGSKQLPYLNKSVPSPFFVSSSFVITIIMSEGKAGRFYYYFIVYRESQILETKKRKKPHELVMFCLYVYSNQLHNNFFL